MTSSSPILVDLVEHTQASANTGIGRHVSEIKHHLDKFDQLSIEVRRNQHPPLANRFTPLALLPVGVKDRRANSIVHFMQIVGTSQMLWHPISPTVATVHDLGVLVCEADEVLFNTFERALMSLQFRGLKRVDFFATTSNYTAQAINDVWGIPANRIKTIYNGIDFDTFCVVDDARTDLYARYGLDANPAEYDILYVGSELPRKNLKTLLGAVKQLIDRGISVRLLKVGGTGGQKWHEQTVTEVNRLGISEHVVFVGRVPEEDLPLFYNAADVFATTTLLEGFGLPVAEAMACGCPVVCTRSGSLLEVAGDATVFVDANNISEIADGLLQVLQDDRRKDEMRTRGLAHVQQFTWERTASALLEIYQSLV